MDPCLNNWKYRLLLLTGWFKREAKMETHEIPGDKHPCKQFICLWISVFETRWTIERPLSMQWLKNDERIISWGSNKELGHVPTMLLFSNTDKFSNLLNWQTLRFKNFQCQCLNNDRYIQFGIFYGFEPLWTQLIKQTQKGFEHCSINDVCYKYKVKAYYIEITPVHCTDTYGSYALKVKDSDGRIHLSIVGFKFSKKTYIIIANCFNIGQLRFAMNKQKILKTIDMNHLSNKPQFMFFFSTLICNCDKSSSCSVLNHCNFKTSCK